jgi:hypothetical protein
MTTPIDLDAEREKRRKLEMYACECGCSMFRIWSDERVECLNCAHSLAGLRVVDDDAPGIPSTD